MGRPRGGKAKRPTPQATKSSEDADAASGDEDAVTPAYKRRGRPQKHLKADDTDEVEEGQDGGKVEPMEDSDGAKPAVPGKGSVENGGKKRRRRRQPSKPRGSDPAEEEDGAVKQSGFRHHGSRRKSTPRRAAEAGVECKNKAAIVQAGAVHKMLRIAEGSASAALTEPVVANFLCLSALDTNKPVIGAFGAAPFLVSAFRDGPRARGAVQPRGGLPRGPPHGEPRPQRGAFPR